MGCKSDGALTNRLSGCRTLHGSTRTSRASSQPHLSGTARTSRHSCLLATATLSLLNCFSGAVENEVLTCEALAASHWGEGHTRSPSRSYLRCRHHTWVCPPFIRLSLRPAKPPGDRILRRLSSLSLLTASSIR
eukprot:1181669-Rhodomonas_salina.2